MTILVTGSSGHLGEALVRCLRERGRSVAGLDVVVAVDVPVELGRLGTGEARAFARAGPVE